MYRIARHIILLLLVMGLVGTTNGCSGSAPSKPANASAVRKSDSSVQVDHKSVSPATAANDEQKFRAFLKEFKVAAQQKNKKQLAGMLYFPLQTTPQWSNNDLKSTAINPTEGLVAANEYPQYERAIFTAAALRLIPKSTEDDLSEIDATTDENYYKVVAKVTDKGSKLYELQQQYTQSHGKETSYGFVFGRINGQYKIISYYSPWPVKG
ncbi:MAG TPA: hypothetical protein VK609_12810 [Mucilaginibacter sp.]|nr:hypothetical protein [Mucilaginibacter sp.]